MTAERMLPRQQPSCGEVGVEAQYLISLETEVGLRASVPGTAALATACWKKAEEDWALGLAPWFEGMLMSEGLSPVTADPALEPRRTLAPDRQARHRCQGSREHLPA